MPTQHPRIQVLVHPEVHADLKRIHRYTGQSMSSLVADMLHGSAPVIRQLADTVERASGLPSPVTVALNRRLASIQAGLEASSEAAQGELDEAQIDIEDYIERTGSDARSVPRAGPSSSRSGKGGGRARPAP